MYLIGLNANPNDLDGKAGFVFVALSGQPKLSKMFFPTPQSSKQFYTSSAKSAHSQVCVLLSGPHAGRLCHGSRSHGPGGCSAGPGKPQACVMHSCLLCRQGIDSIFSSSPLSPSSGPVAMSFGVIAIAVAVVVLVVPGWLLQLSS